uniref:Uncharacterized protein n=1 Tax=Vitis vinifera TaxID=29760 RepID=A5AT63_VITVI|nr:hypothetical protein VITISV_013868 [Vitis vinifera]
MPRVPDQLDRRSVPSFVHAYGSSSSTSGSPMRSSSREAPAYAAPIYSWFRIQIWQRRSRSRGYGLTMNSSSTNLSYCGFPSVPRASIRCSSRSSSRSSCSFTSSLYDDDLEPTEKAAEQAVRYPVTEPADRPS